MKIDSFIIADYIYLIKYRPVRCAYRQPCKSIHFAGAPDRSFLDDYTSSEWREKLYDMPFSREFEVISEITDRERIARGPGVHIRRWLNETYGYGAWRKCKGKAWVRYKNGRVVYAELHYFEAHGIGRVDLKVTREFRRQT